MKSSKKQPRVLVIGSENLPSAKKLIFKRLKPPPEGRKRPAWNAPLRFLKLVFGVFKQAELVRSVSPELPPEPEHRWRKIQLENRL